MSEQKESTIFTIQCPCCGKQTEIKTWPIVKSSEESNLKNRIIDGTFFEQRCEWCGEVFEADYSMMYVDEYNDVVICYASKDEDENWFLQDIQETSKKYDDHWSYRIVKEKNFLREKARIFSKGLDDYVIEIIKVWKTECLRKAGIKEEISLSLCWVQDDCSLEISYFLNGSDEVYVVEVSEEEYQKTEENLLGILMNIEEERYVDLDWAIRIISDNNL